MIRFYNGHVLSFPGGEPSVSGDEVWVDGNSIVYMGPEKADAPVFDRQINLSGNLLMPSLKNAHTHTAMTFLRSRADDKPLSNWLNEDVFPNETKLTDESIYYLARLGFLEYLTSGVSTCFDMYFHNVSFSKACVDSGFRAVICAAMNNFDADITNIEREYLAYNNYDELLSYTLGIHAEYTTCRERIEYMSSLAEKYQAPCFVHISETRSEHEDCLARTGMTPAQYLDSLGFFRYGGGGFHGVWLTDADINLFREKNLSIVTCPCSNLKLASGIAPVMKFLDAGLNVGIGTDGPASNNALDMWREMYLVSVLQKYLTSDASACRAADVLKMACVNGARAIGLTDCDDIAVGKKADMIVIDMDRPSMQPVNNIISNLVFAGSKDCVKMTMINGKILYENGEFLMDEDPAFIYAKAQEFVNAIG